MNEYHRHAIEGGFIIHQAHDLGSEAAALDPIPFEGHRHLVVLMERNYVHEESGAATLDGAEVIDRGDGFIRWKSGNPPPPGRYLVIPLPDKETPQRPKWMSENGGQWEPELPDKETTDDLP